MAGKATGERIDAPKRSKVIALASSGTPETKIAVAVKLSRGTVRAIKAFESDTIQQRKIKLADQFANIAHIGAERLLAEIPNLPPGSLIPAVGMACDKVLAITQEPQSQLSQHLHVHLEKVDLIGQFNAAVHSLANGKADDDIADASTEEKRAVAKEIQNKPANSIEQDS